MHEMRPIQLCIVLLILFCPVKCFKLRQLIYDDSYIVNILDDRFPYLRIKNQSNNYIGPRDYFNFDHVFQPNKSYFENVNLEQHMFDELKAMEITSSIATMDQWHYSDKQQLIDSNKPEASEQRCLKDLEYIESLISLAENNTDELFKPGYKKIQLLRYLDSWGRPPSETYWGHSYWVGSYRGCKQVKLPTDDGDRIKFRYCWSKLKPKSWPNKDEMIPATSFRSGICLPDSCDTIIANKNKNLIHKIMKFNFSPLHRDRFNKIIDIYCLPNDRGIFNTTGSRIFVSLIACWLTIVLLVSLIIKKKRLPNYLSCLTIQENYQQFIQDDEPPPSSALNKPIDFRPIGVARFFGSVLICMGHCVCSFGWVFNSATFTLISSRELKYQLSPSCMKAVDLYLVIAGLFTSYKIFKKFKDQNSISTIIKPKVYIALNLLRYLRLAPMMILVLTFMKYIYPHLSEGPMWDYGTYKYSMQGVCQRSSWDRLFGFPILFYLTGNSYFNECLSVSWYLIADMKLALMAPIIVYLLVKQKTIAKQVKLILILKTISTLWQYKDLSMQKLVYFRQFFSYSQFSGVNILSLTFGETGYYSPMNRLYAFAAGLLAGSMLHRYQNDTKFKWPNWMFGWYFKAYIIWLIYDFFSPLIAQYNFMKTGHIPSEETIKLTILLKPRLDAILFSIILLRLITDLSGQVMFYSKPLYKLGKLSYEVFLIHTIIIAYFLSSNEKSRPDGFFIQYLTFFTVSIIWSYLISFPLYILFESPLAQLLKLTLMSNKRKQDPEEATEMAMLGGLQWKIKPE